MKLAADILTDRTVRIYKRNDHMAADTTTAAPHLPVLEHPLKEGWTLPASWYSDHAVYERERDRIFAGSWQYAGALEHLAEHGSFTTMTAGHIPVVLVR